MIWKRLREIFNLVREGDIFANDPYGWVTNQAAHAVLIGQPFFLLLLAFGMAPVLAIVTVCVVYFLCWEILVQTVKSWTDSAADTFHVSMGAILAASVYEQNLVSAASFFAAWLLTLYLGMDDRMGK